MFAVSAFDLEISNPFPTGATGRLGGPGVGGHTHGPWYVEFGNDLAATAGTAVHAAFAGEVSHVDAGRAGSATGIHGASIFVRATSDALDPAAPGGATACYANIAAATGIELGTELARGDILGHVIEDARFTPHLHFALAERRDGVNVGVDIYSLLGETLNSTSVATLSFSQDGNPLQITRSQIGISERAREQLDDFIKQAKPRR
jgi:murein DD-endopeptidase MepM/ murein hydrolase activator NlpD